MEPINVLSLFDGMSCGQIALERAGIPVNIYCASEIDKYAIRTTQANYPKTWHMGSITQWRHWKLPKIDLVIGGSPCQGFSVASPGRLNFEDPRSKLFFDFCDLLDHVKKENPDVKFLLENVKMKKEWRDVITFMLGVEPVLINSALVSAQNRERYYWANWTITQPEDKHIYLKDIIEEGEVDRDKSYAIDANYFKGGSSEYLQRQKAKSKRQSVATYQSERRLMVKTVPHGFNKGGEELRDKYPSLHAQSPHTNHLILVGQANENNPIRVGTAVDIKGHDYNKRVYSGNGKSPSLAAKSGGNLEPKVATDEKHYRKLTVRECCRLQTVPENYFEGIVSNTQAYKQLGNGWTVDVIVHILGCLYGDIKK